MADQEQLEDPAAPSFRHNDSIRLTSNRRRVSDKNLEDDTADGNHAVQFAPAVGPCALKNSHIHCGFPTYLSISIRPFMRELTDLIPFFLRFFVCCLLRWLNLMDQSTKPIQLPEFSSFTCMFVEKIEILILPHFASVIKVQN
jgi:hypothetical protein